MSASIFLHVELDAVFQKANLKSQSGSQRTYAKKADPSVSDCS